MSLIIGTNTVTKIEIGNREITKIEDINGQVLYEAAPSIDYLCFTANTANSTIGMTHAGTNKTTTKPTIYTSTDKTNWTEWDYTNITLSNAGDKVYMYGTNSNGVSRSSSNYSRFTMSGAISASGNCTTLLSNNGTVDLSGTTSCFYQLFYNCTALTTAPALPATTLANNCYFSMFQGCTALTTAPALPATTLQKNCYNQMFLTCTSLTTAPMLPATTLTQGCYQFMFDQCSNLNNIVCLATDISASYCLSNWLRNVSATGTFTKAASMSGWPTGTGGIPSGWTVNNYIE